MLDKAKLKFSAVIDHFQAEISKLRSGRPTPDMFANIEVLAYGSKTKLSAVGNINIVDATLVTIQPWDKTLIPEIIKGLQSSTAQYNPQAAADLVRVPIPPLTQERREETVKKLGEMAESARVHIRVGRKEIIDGVDAQKQSGEITEDQHKSLLKQIQDLVDQYNNQISEISETKTKSLMTV